MNRFARPTQRHKKWWLAAAGLSPAILVVGVMPAVVGASPAISACTSAQLSAALPAAIPGDPDGGMGKRDWTVTVTNHSSAACTLSGWPTLSVVHGAARVSTRVSQVAFDNLGPVSGAPLTLTPGATAVATAVQATEPTGCVRNASVSLSLPGGARALAQPATAAGNCIGGALTLSPWTSMSELNQQIQTLQTDTTTAAVYANKDENRPAICSVSDLAASVSAASSTVAVVSIRNASSTACFLPGPTVLTRIQRNDGTSDVAKAMAFAQATAASKQTLAFVGRGSDKRLGAVLAAGKAASVELVGSSTSGTCAATKSLSLAPDATNATRTLSVAGSGVRLCGTIRALPTMSASASHAVVTDLASHARATAASPSAQTDASVSPNFVTGYAHGTDSAYPYACGSGPYYEPNGTCAHGNVGYYAFYSGEVGNYRNWKGCTTAGLPYSPSNTTAADYNGAYGNGDGASAYWFAAGPGRDPSYNGSTTEAYAWGKAQGNAAINAVLSKHAAFYAETIYIDVEDAVNTGWNGVWTGACSGTEKAYSVATAVDYATYRGFIDTIRNTSVYWPGVYSAGGSCGGCWSGIFGTYPVGDSTTNTTEWTFVNESSHVSWPGNSFSNPYATAVWYGNPAAGSLSCKAVWQFSGGDGITNTYGGDYDQVNVTNAFNCQA